MSVFDSGTTAGSVATFYRNVTDGTGMDIYVGKSAASGGTGIIKTFPNVGTPTSARMTLGIWGDNLDAGRGLTILKGGNVGIGTTSPGAKLEVNGNIITSAPTADNHVATKAYVDASTGGSSIIRYYTVEPTPLAYRGDQMGGFQGLMNKCINAFGEGSIPFTPQILTSAYYGGPLVTPIAKWPAGYYWYSSLENNWVALFTGYGTTQVRQEIIPKDWFNSKANCNAWTGGTSSYGDSISIDIYDRMGISSRPCTETLCILCAVPHY